MGPGRQRAGTGRLGGVLLLAGALVSAPTRSLHADPAVARLLVEPLLAAVVAGLVCLLVPWARLGRGWLHLVPLTGAAILVTAIVGAGPDGDVYAPLYFVLAAYVAFAFADRRAVAAHGAIICLCSLAPLLYDTRTLAETLPPAALRTFGLLATAALMARVRAGMEAGQAALRELSQSDPLTGVGNYRKLYHRLSYEIRRHQRSEQSLSLLVMDLDGFKAVNDSLGHLAGDRLLQEVARVLGETVRAQDTVARQGGDEFAVLAPETGPEAAQTLAERVERALEEIDTDGPRIGVSVGWAVYPIDGQERMVLLERADARQRAIKRARRASVGATARAA